MSEKIEKLRVLVYALLIFTFLGGVFLYSNSGKEKELVKTFTEKKRYSATEELKVEIKNNMEESVCFSSCYPYFMQSEEGIWSNYLYPQCEKKNLVENCIEPNDTKAFGILLNEMFVKPALHRLAIPACIGCIVGDQFRVDKILYTNEFEIKK